MDSLCIYHLCPPIRRLMPLASMLSLAMQPSFVTPLVMPPLSLAPAKPLLPPSVFSLAVAKDRGQSAEEPLERHLKMTPLDRSDCLPPEGCPSKHQTLLPQSSHRRSPRPLVVQTLLDGASVFLHALPPLASTASRGEQWHAPHAPAGPPAERPLDMPPLAHHHWTSEHFQSS